ncbi:MAG: hypothetical protein QM765_51860 [Myxococcales bacterium]
MRLIPIVFVLLILASCRGEEAPSCPVGDAGSQADAATDPCAGFDCSGHGVCALAAGAPICACDRGYSPSSGGLDCEANLPLGCEGVTCAGHGTCALNAVSSPICQCDQGYQARGLECVAGSAPTLTMTEVAFLDGSDYAPVQQGTLAVLGSHLIAFTGRLAVVDVADPAHPVPVATVDVCGSGWGGRMALVGQRAFVYCLKGPSVVQGYDLSDPAHPRAESSLSLSSAVQGIASADTRLFVKTQTALEVVEVRDPAAPVVVGSVAMAGLSLGIPHRVVAAGSVVVVTGLAGGNMPQWAVVDVSQPASPALLARVGALGATTAFAAADGFIYGGHAVPDSFLVTDLADPSHPRLVGALPMEDPEGIDGVVRWRNFALVSATGGTAIDLSSPSNPSKAGFIRHGQDVRIEGALALGGDYLYAGFQQAGLAVIALSTH